MNKYNDILSFIEKKNKEKEYNKILSYIKNKKERTQIEEDMTPDEVSQFISNKIMEYINNHFDQNNN